VAIADRWTALVDPTAAEVESALPVELHPAARDILLAPPTHGAPRPRIESHGDYVVGVLLAAVAVPAENRIFYQEVAFVLTPERFVTVARTPPGDAPFDAEPAIASCRADDPTGMYLFRVVDEIAERYLDLVDDLDDEIDELEGEIDAAPAMRVRARIAALRRDFLRVRRTLTPTRDAVHRIVDDRVELDRSELFPRDVELHFADAYDKLLRAVEGLENSRDLVAGVRDYFQAKVANDQNDVIKRLTVIASLLLLPTFIVGLYGQNFRDMPEVAWWFGYWWSWAWIVLTTVAQLAFFRWKRWI
jgi:magnesium transporter